MTSDRYEEPPSRDGATALPARLALLGLNSQEESAWREAANEQAVEVVTVMASGECAAYAGLNVPLVVVAQTGPTLEPRLADPSDPTLGPVPLIVVSQDLHEQTLWSAVTWDALLGPVATHDAGVALRAAVEEARQRLVDSRLVTEFRRRYALLTDNELPVYTAVCAGRLNKQIAGELSVSVRTVEQRRRRVFEKMGVESAVPLAAMAATVRTLAAQARRCRRQANSVAQPREDEPGNPFRPTKASMIAGLPLSSALKATACGG